MTVWPVKTLGEVCEVSRGTSITRKETTAGTVPVVAGGVDFAYFHSIANRAAGCITVSSSGANAGFVNRWSMPIFASDCSTVISRGEGLVLSDFAFRFLQFKQYFIYSELRRGAAQPHVYAKDIAAIEIPVPPLEEQKRIVELLDAATAHVTELNACYEQARTHVNNLFTSALRDELEGNPDWPVKTLGAVCEVLDNLRKPITKRNRTSGDYPYYGATGIVDHVGDYIFDERLVLVGEDGAKWGAGERTAFIAEGKYWVNNHAHVLRCKQGVLVDSWLANFLTMSDLNRYVSGLTVPKLNQGSLVSIEIPVPPLEEQKRIVARLDLMKAKTSEMVAAYDAKLQAAKNLRQSILEAAFAGQL